MRGKCMSLCVLGLCHTLSVLQVSCSAQGLMVFVQDRSFLCVLKGQLLSISVRVNEWVYNGVLICPACTDFCDDCPLPYHLPPINTSRSNPIGQSVDQLI